MEIKPQVGGISSIDKNRRQYIREVRKGVRRSQIDLIDFIHYYRSHPVEACYDILGISLMPYQKELLRNSWGKAFPLWVMSRGSGKSYLAAIDMGLNAILFPNMRIGIIAPSYRQSKFLFLKFKEEVYNKSKILRKFVVGNMKEGNEECKVQFSNGSFIQALPFGDGSTIRGQRYNTIYIDEYAAIDEQIVRLVVEPMLTVKRGFDPDNPDDSEGNRVVIFSSAYYTWNHFYEATQRYLSRIKGGDNDYYVAVVDYRMPLKYGLYDERAIAKAKKDNTEGDFLMEYGSVFQSESQGSWIPTMIFDRRVVWDQDLEPRLIGQRNKEYGLYCDFSISQQDSADNTTFLICELEPNGKNKPILVRAEKGLTLDAIHARMRKYDADFNLRHIWMDGEKLGLALKGYLEKPYTNPETGEEQLPLLDIEGNNPDVVGKKFVKYFRHSAENNHNMGLAAKRMVEQRRIVMPVLQDRHEDPDIELAYLELLAMKKEITQIKAVPSGMYYKFEQEKKSTLKRDRWTVFAYSCMALEDRLHGEDEDDFIFAVV